MSDEIPKQPWRFASFVRKENCLGLSDTHELVMRSRGNRYFRRFLRNGKIDGVALKYPIMLALAMEVGEMCFSV